MPTVLFRPYEEEGKVRHGNFHPESYLQLTETPEWRVRLSKPHSGKSRSLNSADQASAMELDSCTSSDALLMNIFCHPSTMANPLIARLFGQEGLPEIRFGFQPRLPLSNGKEEPRSTEIDLCLGLKDRPLVLIEAKLTENDFTRCQKARIERYQGFFEVFDREFLPTKEDKYEHYQLLRNLLAAHHLRTSFFLLCDQRRKDLLVAWEAVSRAVNLPELRDRCGVLTWQEIAAVSTSDLRDFLAVKYGIVP